MDGSLSFITFTGGEIGKETLARVKLESYAAMAEIMENWLPETAGPMMSRPGFLFKTQPTATNDFVHMIPFVRGLDVKYLLLLSDSELRIALNGAIVGHTAVSCTIPGGAFETALDLSYWTNISAGGGGIALDGGRLKLTSDGTSVAGVRQSITTSSAGTAHGLDITVSRGPVYLTVGSTAGGTDLLDRTELRTGSHTLLITPTAGTFWIDIKSTSKAIRYLDNITISSSGDIVLPTPWTESVLRSLRFEQSGDVMFISSGAGERKRIERRGASSWSVVDTGEVDGPFQDPNTDEAIQLTPSVTSGNGTLSSTSALFSTGHVGALFQVTHGGQLVSRAISGGGQFSDPIKVQGTGSGRTFTYTITGTWVGTVRIQRSIGNDTSWADYSSFTANATNTVTDGLDNQIVYYRIGVKSGEYTSGTPNVQLSYTGGTSSGVARVTGFTSSTQVDIEVVKSFAATSASSDWAEGAWSDAADWAKGTALFDGRMWDGYSDKIVGSVSDAYESYERGDAADNAVLRTIATGRVNPVQWLMPLKRLLIGTQGAEVEIKSSSFDEPITPSNSTIRTISTYGSADIQPLVLDTYGLFVERSGVRMMRVAYSVDAQSYGTDSMMRLNVDIGRPGIVQMAASRQPHTRIWAVRSDGQLLAMLYEPGENVLNGWVRILAADSDAGSATIESVATLPGSGEDEVYVMVKRTINGATVRYLEQLAPMHIEAATDVVGSDSAKTWSGTAATVISGFDHLKGETVAVLADGAVRQDAVVATDGTITLTRAASKVTAGLRYAARYKSAKLAYGAQGGTALGQKGRNLHAIFLLLESMKGLYYGSDFDTMDQLKDRDIESQYDSGPGLVTATSEQLAMPGRHERDPRICLKAESPQRVRLSGYVLAKGLNERN